MVDGHNSHYTLELLVFARKHKIVIVCYPAHTTHVLQGLDVACFAAFKVYWSQETTKFTAENNQKVSRDNILTPLSAAYNRAFIPSTIMSAFRKTGVWPLDPTAIDPELVAPSQESSLSTHLPVPLPSPIKDIADGIAFQQSMQSSSPIHVFYTPTKTRSIPIDPAIIAAAEVKASTDSSSLSFLTSDAAIESSSSMPRINRAPLHQPHSLLADFLKEIPVTDQAYRLQVVLRESVAREAELLRILTIERTHFILAELHCTKLKHQLYAKEEKRKKAKGKLTGDGLPRVLTSDSFLQLVHEHREAQEAAELDRLNREKEKEGVERLKLAWAEEQKKIDEMNRRQQEEYQKELTLWEAERDLAKEQRRRTQWPKPKKAPRIPNLPKPWVKPRTVRAPESTDMNLDSPLDATRAVEDDERSSDNDSDGGG
jgi:hypothetical protein